MDLVKLHLIMRATVPLAASFRQELMDNASILPLPAFINWPASFSITTQSQTTEHSHGSSGQRCGSDAEVGEGASPDPMQGNHGQPSIHIPSDDSSLDESEDDYGDVKASSVLKRKAVNTLPQDHPYYRDLDYVQSTSGSA
jgi:hypothetical protein